MLSRSAEATEYAKPVERSYIFDPIDYSRIPFSSFVRECNLPFGEIPPPNRIEQGDGRSPPFCFLLNFAIFALNGKRISHDQPHFIGSTRRICFPRWFLLIAGRFHLTTANLNMTSWLFIASVPETCSGRSSVCHHPLARILVRLSRDSRGCVRDRPDPRLRRRSVFLRFHAHLCRSGATVFSTAYERAVVCGRARNYRHHFSRRARWGSSLLRRIGTCRHLCSWFAPASFHLRYLALPVLPFIG